VFLSGDHGVHPKAFLRRVSPDIVRGKNEVSGAKFLDRAVGFLIYPIVLVLMRDSARKW
jgi:hypothetical protein